MTTLEYSFNKSQIAILSISCTLFLIMGIWIGIHASPNTNPNSPENNPVVKLPIPPEGFIEWYIEHKESCITCQTPIVTASCREKNAKLDGYDDPSWTWNYKYEWWTYDGEPIEGYTWVPSEQRWRESTKPIEIHLDLRVPE